MSESKPPPQRNVDLDFELPDPHGFVSERYPVSAEDILRLSEERLPYITSLPGFYERRLADKVDVPFEL